MRNIWFVKKFSICGKNLIQLWLFEIAAAKRTFDLQAFVCTVNRQL